MKKEININVRIDETIKRALDEAAAADDRPYSSLVRRWIVAGLNTELQRKQCGVLQNMRRKTA